MAEAIGEASSVRGPQSTALLGRAVWTLRLVLGFTVLLGTIIFLLGTGWDIQWHSFIGRDRTLIPPHLVMLSGVTLSGLVALVGVVIETLWARHSSTRAKISTRFMSFFHAPLGAYLAGFAALDAAIAFPLDSYWHALYGIDVSIWTPFHVMILVSMAMAALGAAYMLMSAAHLAASTGNRRTVLAGNAGVIVALATMMGILTLLLPDARSEKGYIDLGGVIVNVFPLMVALLGTWTFVAVVHALSTRAAATCVAAVHILFALLIAVIVPPATDLLAQQEGLSYLLGADENPHLAAVTIRWPFSLIVVAILIDISIWLAQRRNWSPPGRAVTVGTTAIIGCVLVPILDPLYIGFMQQMAQADEMAGILTISLLVGVLGTMMGSWFGRNMGEFMHSLER